MIEDQQRRIGAVDLLDSRPHYSRSILRPCALGASTVDWSMQRAVTSRPRARRRSSGPRAAPSRTMCALASVTLFFGNHLLKDSSRLPGRRVPRQQHGLEGHKIRRANHRLLSFHDRKILGLERPPYGVRARLRDLLRLRPDSFGATHSIPVMRRCFCFRGKEVNPGCLGPVGTAPSGQCCSAIQLDQGRSLPATVQPAVHFRARRQSKNLLQERR